MCLDGKGDTKRPDIHILPGRRSYSLDVRAGAEDVIVDVVKA